MCGREEGEEVGLPLLLWRWVAFLSWGWWVVSLLEIHFMVNREYVKMSFQKRCAFWVVALVSGGPCLPSVVVVVALAFLRW